MKINENRKFKIFRKDRRLCGAGFIFYIYKKIENQMIVNL